MPPEPVADLRVCGWLFFCRLEEGNCLYSPNEKTKEITAEDAEDRRGNLL